MPADARGLYLTADGTGFAALQQIDGRLFFITNRRAVLVRAQKAPDGFTLTTPKPADPPEGDEERLPKALPLRAPVADDPRWKLGVFLQWRDAWATRLTGSEPPANPETRELHAIDDKEIGARLRLRRYTRLLRDRSADELRAEVDSIDPAAVALVGGAAAFVAEQLGIVLDDLRDAVPTNETTRFASYQRTLRLVASNDKAPLWPARDDAFLIELVKRRWPTRDTLVIRDGSLMTVNAVDAARPRDCVHGILVPDPSENQSHAVKAWEAPAAGKLGGFSYAFFAFQTGQPGSCGAPLTARTRYPVVPGSFLFRLFADAQGRVVGAQAGRLFVARGLDPHGLDAMLQANDEQLSRLAE